MAKEVVSRSGDQCWKRWNDSLDPHLNHSQWTPAEDAILEAAVLRSGRLWSKIANDNLSGRSGLSCKNRWDHIQRKQRRIHQSQRDILNGHHHSFLDSTHLHHTSQHQSGYLSNSHNDLTQAEINSRHSLIGDGFHRHSNDSIEYDAEDDSPSVLSSSAGSHMYNSTSLPRIAPRTLDQPLSTSWSNSTSANRSIATSTFANNSTLPPYVNRQASFTSSLTLEKVPSMATGYFSSFPASTLGSNLSHSSSNNKYGTADYSTTSQPYRHHLSWFKNQSNSSSEAVTQQSSSTSLSISQGSSTNSGDIPGRSAEVESSPFTSNTSQYRHQHLRQQRTHISDESSMESTTSFRHQPSSFGSGSSFPNFSNSLPTRSDTIFPRQNHSTQSSQTVWGSRENEGHTTTTPLASSMLTRPLALKQEESQYDADRFRWQTSYTTSSASTNQVDRRNWSANGSRNSTSRDGFNIETRSVQRPASSHHHPFAFSPDTTTPTVEEQSYQSDGFHQQDKLENSFSGSDKSKEEGTYLAAHSSDEGSDSFQSYHHDRAPVLEDVSNSVFYDDLRYQSHARRQREEDYQEDEVTSDEEEEDKEQVNNYSSKSPIGRSQFALL